MMHLSKPGALDAAAQGVQISIADHKHPPCSCKLIARTSQSPRLAHVFYVQVISFNLKGFLWQVSTV
jgi:hypothetical protein